MSGKKRIINFKYIIILHISLIADSRSSALSYSVRIKPFKNFNILHIIVIFIRYDFRIYVKMRTALRVSRSL
jgi:hypothetical protein